MITRFAPSPTGYLHLGHVFAAEIAFGRARTLGGTCLLRVEDIDVTRCKPEFTRAIYEDLSWLGFSWPEPVRVQSQHVQSYQEVIDKLAADGLLYRCFKSRREIQATLETEGEVYRGPSAELSEDEQQSRIASGQTFAWRLSMNRAKDTLGGGVFDGLFFMDTGSGVPQLCPAKAWDFGDEVIGRADIGVSYHLACTHDDHVQGVTEVVRGSDFFDLTGFQILLQNLMGWKTPLYHHHELVKDDDGQKLSKRDAATAVRAMREAGHTPEHVLDLATVNIAR